MPDAIILTLGNSVEKVGSVNLLHNYWYCGWYCTMTPPQTGFEASADNAHKMELRKRMHYPAPALFYRTSSAQHYILPWEDFIYPLPADPDEGSLAYWSEQASGLMVRVGIRTQGLGSSRSQS